MDRQSDSQFIRRARETGEETRVVLERTRVTLSRARVTLRRMEQARVNRVTGLRLLTPEADTV